MPVQQQMSSFAKKLGGRVAAANAEHRDKPVDTGNRRLPAGIRDGVARLAAMYTKEQETDGGKTPKGQVFFRASAVVLSPTEHNHEKIAGLTTSLVIPLCDVPAKGQRKAETFEQNWYEFQNVFKLLGVAPCPETTATDPTGAKTEAYFMAAMKMLTDPVRMKTNPVYISFSTRGWTPPATQQQPKPEEMVFETWHGLAEWSAPPDPAAGIVEGTNAAAVQPGPMSAPPSTNGPPTQTAAARGAAPPPVSGPPPQYQPGGDPDPADVVAALVDVAMDDPEGATDEGANAGAQLQEMAWAKGWTEEQTAGAQDWAAVGDMALNPPTVTTPPTTPTQLTTPATPLDATPAVGSRWMFARRSKTGERLKNGKGEEFPPQEVEVTAVDSGTKTCTVRTAKDGKDVVDIRSKKPVAVQFGWLESLPY